MVSCPNPRIARSCSRYSPTTAGTSSSSWAQCSADSPRPSAGPAHCDAPHLLCDGRSPGQDCSRAADPEQHPGHRDHLLDRRARCPRRREPGCRARPGSWGPSRADPGGRSRRDRDVAQPHEAAPSVRTRDPHASSQERRSGGRQDDEAVSPARRVLVTSTRPRVTPFGRRSARGPPTVRRLGRPRVRPTPEAPPSAGRPAPRAARRPTRRPPRRTRPAPGRRARPCCRSVRRSGRRWSGPR